MTGKLSAQTITGAGDSTTVLLSGTGSSTPTTINGQTWNQISSSAFTSSLSAANGSSSGIELNYLNTGGFNSSNRGSEVEVTVGSVVFPEAVTHSYAADNFGAAGRDGLMVLRFISDFQLEVNMTFLSSVQHNNPPEGQNIVHWNVGGVYGGTSDRNFTGGTTATLDASKQNLVNETTFRYDTGSISSVLSSFDSDLNKWILDLQIGHGGSSNSAVTALSGLHMEITAIPEPSTYALFAGALAIGLLIRRRMIVNKA